MWKETNKFIRKQVFDLIKLEIREEEIPPPIETPKKYIAEPIEPENIKINYDNPIAAPFTKLVDN